MRLIGSNHKPVPGESLLWLLARSSEHNYFSRCDVIEVFSNKTKLAFSTRAKSNPGTIEGFDLNAMNAYLAIPEENLAYSLITFYTPEFIDTYENQIHEQIRLCPKCAEQGTHLLIHQVKLWDKCPVHNRKLIKACWFCGSTLGRFAVEFEKRGDAFNPFRCHCCGTNLVPPYKLLSSHQIGKLEKLITEYADWMEKVNNAYAKIYLLDTNKQPGVSSLQSSMLMSNSPNWAKRCLEIKKNHQESEYCIHNSTTVSVAQNSECHDAALTDALIDQYAKHLLLNAEKCQLDIKETFEITADTINNTNGAKTHIPQVRKTGKYSIWCEAFIYLKNYIELFKKDYERYLFLKEKGQKEWMFYSYGNPGLFEELMAGPIKSFTKSDHSIVNKKTAFKILKLWVNYYLYSLYCNYIGKIITQDLSLFWLYGDSKNDVDDYMLSVEDGNTYFYYHYRDTVRFHISSSKCIHIDELKSIFKSGFKTTYGFEHSQKIRRQIKRVVPHTDLKLEEKALITKALNQRKKAV